MNTENLVSRTNQNGTNWPDSKSLLERTLETQNYHVRKELVIYTFSKAHSSFVYVVVVVVVVVAVVVVVVVVVVVGGGGGGGVVVVVGVLAGGLLFFVFVFVQLVFCF